MCGLKYHPASQPSPIAVGLRVADVRRAAEFYQTIGFSYVMAVPDDDDGWLLCLLRCGNASILLGAVDHPRFPRTTAGQRAAGGIPALGARIDLGVRDLAATYAACVAAGCHVTIDPLKGYWGPRSFRCLDPFGYEWQFAPTAHAVRSSNPAPLAEAASS